MAPAEPRPHQPRCVALFTADAATPNDLWREPAVV